MPAVVIGGIGTLAVSAFCSHFQEALRQLAKGAAWAMQLFQLAAHTLQGALDCKTVGFQNGGHISGLPDEGDNDDHGFRRNGQEDHIMFANRVDAQI